ncbi:hypothetical protein Tco_0214774 [Tanacetum coccineum]
MEESVVRQLCRLRLEKKSYADKKRKPLKFSVGDYVLLKVSPWKGVVRFGKKGKLAPRFVRPFEIIEKAGPVVYRLDFPEELNGVHDTFHVSNLKKCLADPTLQVPLNEIRVDDKLNFVEEPMEILERDFKKLKRSKISIVKVRWNLKCGPEFTWEREDQMKLKYPHLCSDLEYEHVAMRLILLDVRWLRLVLPACLAFIKTVLSRTPNYSTSEEPKEEPIKEEPLEELKEEELLKESEEEIDSDLLSNARSRPGPADSGNSCESEVKPKRGPT